MRCRVEPDVRTWVALVITLVGVEAASAQPIDLFPRTALAPPGARLDRLVELDAAWRRVEHEVSAHFRPTAEQVSDESGPEVLARQLVRRREAAPSPPKRSDDGSRISSGDPGGIAAFRGEQIVTAQAAYEEPASWVGVRVGTTIDAAGRVVSIEVVGSSGRPALDARALATVRSVLGARAGRALHGPLVARFLVESAVSVALPAQAITDDLIGKPKGVMVPVARGRFGGDRKTEVTLPFQRRVHVRATLEELTAASEPAHEPR